MGLRVRHATSSWEEAIALRRGAASLKNCTKTVSDAGARSPSYSGLASRTACLLAEYSDSMKGPEPTTCSSSSRLSAGKVSSSTMEAVALERILRNVRSGWLRLKTTVWSSGVSTAPSARASRSGSLIAPSSTAEPLGSAICRLRSSEKRTSEEVSSLPLEKVRPSRRVQVMVCGSSYSHDSAASPTGSDSPAGIAISCSKREYCMFQEPMS